MNKNTLVLTVSFFLLFLSFHPVFFSDSHHLKTQFKSDSNLILLIIDLNTLICPLCHDSIEKVLIDLKMKNPEKIKGIVVCNRSFPKSKKNIRIINKQIKGFKKRLDLSFQIYMDFNGHFSCLKGNGITLLELDKTGNCILKKSLFRKNVNHENF